jgi:hypothetical protein
VGAPLSWRSTCCSTLSSASRHERSAAVYSSIRDIPNRSGAFEAKCLAHLRRGLPGPPGASPGLVMCAYLSPRRLTSNLLAIDSTIGKLGQRASKCAYIPLACVNWITSLPCNHKRTLFFPARTVSSWTIRSYQAISETSHADDIDYQFKRR